MNRRRPIYARRGPLLSTTITRTDPWTDEEYDVEIDYVVEPGSPGCRTTRSGDPGYPPEDAEVEIVRAVRSDTREDVDLTDDEIDEVRAGAEEAARDAYEAARADAREDR